MPHRNAGAFMLHLAALLFRREDGAYYIHSNENHDEDRISNNRVMIVRSSHPPSPSIGISLRRSITSSVRLMSAAERSRARAAV